MDHNIGIDNRIVIIPFLRELFLEKVNFKLIKGKRIYITRRYSEKQHNGIFKRIMLNEDEFIKKILEKYNIEFIQLEDFNMFEKIKLFMESELIISPHSGCLTLLTFSNINCKVIEIINNGSNGFNTKYYMYISSLLNLNYNRYSNISEDDDGNFNFNIDDFENYLLKLL